MYFHFPFENETDMRIIIILYYHYYVILQQRSWDEMRILYLLKGFKGHETWLTKETSTLSSF